MPALIPVDNNLGAVFIGVVLSAVIYGITWMQIYMYYTEYGVRDNRFLKSFVALLMALDTLHLAFLIHGTYHVAVTNFGDYLSDLIAPWSLISNILIGIIMGKLVQLFYAYRLYHLSNGSPYVPAVIAMLSAVELGLGIKYVVVCFKAKYYSAGPTEIPWSVSALSSEVTCDFLITVSMVRYLLGSRGARQTTNQAIMTLVRYVVNSGALTLAFAIACLVSFIKTPRTMIYAPFYFILVRLYSCAFMAILNSRTIIKEKLQAPNVMTNTNIQFPHFTRTVESSSDDTTSRSGQANVVLSEKPNDSEVAETVEGADGIQKVFGVTAFSQV
ncbi:hypothetical protein FA95DRAFT_625771 [Auriscalpium vulgare]|uniref:Uncharacterized protein n=1 Tax=Auriscalpium vulgare TaxID=40419 RepID=A0ACB8RD54_9AGAM|nr:hypothetical protein FA95DRAFT_625771 [Auriscalpium vulgare]